MCGNYFVNPPFQLIIKVLDVVTSQAFATLIALQWPNRSWYQRLQRLLVASLYDNTKQTLGLQTDEQTGGTTEKSTVETVCLQDK